MQWICRLSLRLRNILFSSSLGCTPVYKNSSIIYQHYHLFFVINLKYLLFSTILCIKSIEINAYLLSQVCKGNTKFILFQNIMNELNNNDYVFSLFSDSELTFICSLAVVYWSFNVKLNLPHISMAILIASLCLIFIIYLFLKDSLEI